MRHFQGSITYFSCFLTKDRTEQSLLSSQLCLSLRGYFTNQDVSGTYLCTDTDDTSLIQILQGVLADTRNVTGDLFRSQLSITGFCLVLFNMNGCVNVIHNQSFT